MKLKIVDNFDASFTLAKDNREKLFTLLTNEKFLAEISQHLEGTEVEFTELLFQPVPYSLATPKGMPPEFEHYHNCDDYLIINVPPNFMFKAKVFQPNRLCAIYKKMK
jgi:hypothetical protein